MTEEEAPQQVTRRILRPPLHQATLILPKTGERIKKTFTLRRSGASSSGIEDETSPLLHRSSSSLHHGSTTEEIPGWMKSLALKTTSFATSQTGIGILKCSLAYLIGSMATFVGPIAALLGKNDGKHMVATVTVYFHPARSAGSMQEATFLALCAFLYAAFISFTSMAVSVFFGHQDLLLIGHILVLVIFCGGGLGLVGWLKQKLANPLVNVACSLTSLAIITILTKEGAVQAAMFSYQKIFQVLKMVFMGIIASTSVSLLVKPVSARMDLRDNIRKANDSIAEMMTIITSSFLSGTEEDLHRPSFTAASAKYKSIFKSLIKNLGEAKYEHYFLGTEKQYWIEYKLVKCMERLSQDIGGLRSAATTQFAILSKASADAMPTGSGYDLTFSPIAFSPLSRSFSNLSAINDIEDTGFGKDNDAFLSKSMSLGATITPEDIFNIFISHLGPPMKSLAFTLKEVLEELPFGASPDYLMTINTNFRGSLVDAIDLYAKARKEALSLVYKNKVPNRTNSMEAAADFEEVAASCGYFSTSLQDFAEDTILFLDILDELKENLTKQPRDRSWGWLFFWRKSHTDAEGNTHSDHSSFVAEDPERGFSKAIPAHKRPSTPDLKLPRHLPPLRYRLWIAGRFFRRDDIRFATKVGVGAVLYAMWSFIPATRPFYSHWRGEWGLLSYMLVCSMTIGASNTTGFQRFIGTCIGAVCAVIAWIVSNEDPFVLAFFGWVVSLGCFYIIVGQGKGPMGRFILLTYNLSALYAYSLSVKDDEDDDDEGGARPEIWGIVLHRVVSVMVGCLWGLIVTRVIWPISARRKLKNCISLVWLRMSLIWKRDPLTVLLEDDREPSDIEIRQSLELQRSLAYLETLRISASSEFELRGPFQDAVYSRILQATSRIVDAFYALNILISKDLKASPGEADLLSYTKKERVQLSWRISHLFSVLASSMKLEYPLNDVLPNIEHTRDRLLAKIFDYRKRGAAKDIITDEDYEVLYAYALVAGQIAQDIFAIGQDIELLYGSLTEESLKLD